MNLADPITAVASMSALQWAGVVTLALINGTLVAAVARGIRQQDKFNETIVADQKAHHAADDVRFIEGERALSAHLVESANAHAALAASGMAHEAAAIARVSGIITQLTGELKEARDRIDGLHLLVTRIDERQLHTPAPPTGKRSA